jgi:hypothetical protein
LRTDCRAAASSDAYLRAIDCAASIDAEPDRIVDAVARNFDLVLTIWAESGERRCPRSTRVRLRSSW